ncbi:MAG: hypothetical protein AAGC64_09310 [Bacteroidota bacterium]
MRPDEVAPHTEVQSAERRGVEIVDRAGLDTRIRLTEGGLGFYVLETRSQPIS